MIGPIERDASSGHRRYGEKDLDTLQALACLRTRGVGIEDMRTYQANRELRRAAAGDLRRPRCARPLNLRRTRGRLRATLRSVDREPGLREAVRRGGALEVVAADLTADDGWAAAMAGCEEVHHLATPFPAAQPTDPDELLVPAREGTLRVLRAARDAGARRVVLTSSFAAVGYSPAPGQTEFTEADWTDPDAPGFPPYPRSKAAAERAAWDLIEREGGDTELVSVNPTFILGPLLTAELRSSVQLVKAMLDGTMELAPRQWFGIADVRDVADLHVRAMAAPQAAGKRYLALADGPTISFLGLARILRERSARSPSRCRRRRRRGRTDRS